MKEQGPYDHKKTGKDRRQMPEKKQSADTPLPGRELVFKERPPALSPREILARSTEKVQELAEAALVDPDAVFGPFSVNELLKIKDLQGKPATIRLWAEKFEPKKKDIGREVASLYFQAAASGDETAYERLTELLTMEQNREEKIMRKSLGEGDSYEYKRSNAMLTSVIEHCAREGIPPDRWITTYALNADHAAYLKLEYYNSIPKTDEAEEQRARHYRDEVTDDFLRGTTISKEFRIEHAKLLWSLQTDPLVKRGILDIVKAFPDDLTLLQYETFKKLLKFSIQALQEPDIVESHEVTWMQDTFSKYADQFIRNGFDQYDVRENMFGLWVGIATFPPTNPDRIRERVDFISSELLSIAIPQDTSEDTPYSRNANAARLRNQFLTQIAFSFGDQGDFATAGMFVEDIMDEDKRATAFMGCIKKAKTAEEIDALRNNNSLIELSAEKEQQVQLVSEVQKALITDDVDQITELATQIKGYPDFETDYFLAGMMEECLRYLYRFDPLLGNTICTNVLETLEQNNADDSFIKCYAGIQADAGDSEGLVKLYENAAMESDLSTQLNKYVFLIHQTKKHLDATQDRRK